ncbi:hypothetical protein Cfor_08064 [Coptotermes formosanus]|uniref:Uncharacterized protein n=1 Tax=Coptotermes formosanus TaxID=36987 RepID=A0A6L2Q7W5_COPFO|nr:hypothetical protein Cfor_08064 [Coptotermes formosanus]
MTSVASLWDKQEYNSSDWWLFIDSLQRSLKAVLLHNRNSKTSIAIAHSVHFKETYNNMKILLEAIQCNVHQGNTCGDLKVIGIFMGMQGSFTKFCCFLCLRDSYSTAERYIECDWEPRKTYKPGKDSVQHIPLINPMKIFLPPPQLRLSKYLVKAMAETNSKGFQYLSKNLPIISTAKLKEGIFVGPQIREMQEGAAFVETCD